MSWKVTQAIGEIRAPKSLLQWNFKKQKQKQNYFLKTKKIKISTKKKQKKKQKEKKRKLSKKKQKIFFFFKEKLHWNHFEKWYEIEMKIAYAKGPIIYFSENTKEKSFE